MARTKQFPKSTGEKKAFQSSNSSARRSGSSDADRRSLTKIECGYDFWCLFDALKSDGSVFVHNRSVLADGFKEGNLYGLRVSETDAMYARVAMQDDIFCPGSAYLLPCLCLLNGDGDVEIIWTHTRARRKGFASKLVELLGVRRANNPLSGSDKFWKHCNVQCYSNGKPVFFVDSSEDEDEDKDDVADDETVCICL